MSKCYWMLRFYARSCSKSVILYGYSQTTHSVKKKGPPPQKKEDVAEEGGGNVDCPPSPPPLIPPWIRCVLYSKV